MQFGCIYTSSPSSSSLSVILFVTMEVSTDSLDLTPLSFSSSPSPYNPLVPLSRSPSSPSSASSTSSSLSSSISSSSSTSFPPNLLFSFLSPFAPSASLPSLTSPLSTGDVLASKTLLEWTTCPICLQVQHTAYLR
ncbi:transmembrane protein, partial [Cystoisospora suis]